MRSRRNREPPRSNVVCVLFGVFLYFVNNFKNDTIDDVDEQNTVHHKIDVDGRRLMMAMTLLLIYV